MGPFRARGGRTVLFAAAFLLSTSCLTSCLVRRRIVKPSGNLQNRPLLKATKAELLAKIRNASEAIESFSMKVDLSPSVGMLYGGKVTDYPTISGYIFYRKPDQIRVVGLDPVVHGTAFDMLSKGNEFRVHIPSRNEFIEGSNDAPANSANKLENLRPETFLQSLLMRPPEVGPDMSILEDNTDESQAIYVVLLVGYDKGRALRALRNVYFDRYTLQISRQRTFDSEGNTVSDTKYANWKIFNGVPFPALIDIQRPQDGYELGLVVTELKLNDQGVTDEKFVLEQPPGAHVKVLK
jgi:hypothetical protein